MNFNASNIFTHNRKVINTKQGEILIYCDGGWTAKKYDNTKEIYEMETIKYKEEIFSFCAWLNEIII
jgi:hypothetical protein